MKEKKKHCINFITIVLQLLVVGSDGGLIVAFFFSFFLLFFLVWFWFWGRRSFACSLFVLFLLLFHFSVPLSRGCIPEKSTSFGDLSYNFKGGSSPVFPSLVFPLFSPGVGGLSLIHI